ncbi:MAG: hypothetical protein JSU01_15180 [Bacteroidetes bacterium]|nr:hypothetical protein [Bacteroidota bacterium]
MLNHYPIRNLGFILCAVLFSFGCKKESGSKTAALVPVVPQYNTPGQPYQLGFYEVESKGIKELQTIVSKVGDKPVNFEMTFDTGSGGLVLDAQGILPTSMISTTGFAFSGDSTTVNGITITNQTTFISYGADNSTLSKVFGNLAYADVMIGDNNGNITIRRLPFFLYYKAIDASGTVYPAHKFDVMGVSSAYDVTFANKAYITSPFFYFDPGPGLTRGFKIAALGMDNFSAHGTYVPAVTLGLTADDLGSGGFKMMPLVQVDDDGYATMVQGTVGYNNKNFSTSLIFDSGTYPYYYLEDPNWTDTPGLLKPGTHVQVSTDAGFTFSYIATPNMNPTMVENPASVKGSVSVISLNFFLHNEYLLDFDHHQLGLKND